MDTETQNAFIVFAIIIGLVLTFGIAMAAAIMVKPYEIPPFEIKK